VGRQRKEPRVGIRAILSDRRVTAVVLVVFIVMAGAGLVLPILPLFARSFGVGYGAVGVLVSAYGLARLVFDLVAGPIVDRFGERATAVGGLAVIGLGSALTGIAPSFPLAVVAWAAAGVGSAIALAAMYTRVLRVVPTQQMARTLGIFYGAFNTGFVAGGAAGGLIADRFGLAGPLLVNAVVVALAAAAGVAIDNAQLYAAAQRRQRWLVAAAEITDVLLGRVDRRAALRLVARRAREVGEAALALVLLHDDETGLLTVEVAESGDDETASELVGTTLSVPETEFADAVIARRHVLIEHLGKAAPWPTALAVRAATVVPLVTSEALHGLLVMAYRPGERRENGEDLAMLSAFAGQAALALERALAQEEREMLAVLEDRERIARDLHDVVIQRLFATGLQLQTTAQLTARPDVAARVNASVDDLDTTIRDIRSAIFELRTPVRAALRGELREVVDAAAGLLDFHPTLEVSGAVDSAASAELRADVLAVVREALSNVVRHAAASRVRVQVRLDAGWLTVTVEDDGVGTDPAVPRGGLTNLNERATRRGGSFTVQRMEPTGTLVDWRVPI